MKIIVFVLFVTNLTCIGVTQADEATAPATPQSEKQAETVKSTFLITGLHCPPCTQTVEESLRHIKGVKSASVDWKTKNARIEFDEHVISAQALAGKIATTAHMMGGSMKYSGWLALSVADLKESDNAEWDRLKESLGKVAGVKQVSLYKNRAGVGVLFDTKGELTSEQVIAAMADAGFKVSNYRSSGH